jgi:hypothetical protein
MLDNYVVKRFIFFNWRINMKLITTPKRKKEYKSTLDLTICTYTGTFLERLLKAIWNI